MTGLEFLWTRTTLRLHRGWTRDGSPARRVPTPFLMLLTLALAVPGAAQARETASPVSAPRIAVVYNATSEDRGYNKLIIAGVRTFESQRGSRLLLYEQPYNQVYDGDALQQVLAKAVPAGVEGMLVAGVLPIADSIAAIAASYPGLRLVVLDGFGDTQGRIQLVQFRFEEAAYLAGLAAARSTRSGVLGFVGGMDSATIRSFACAYAQGARDERGDLPVLWRMVGGGGDAFNDPQRGKQLAKELLDAQADVIFAAAGASGLGVLEAAATAGVLAIGVDDNQNGLYPGHILTSVLKRMDVVTYSSLVALHDGKWAPGVQSVGLAEGAVGLAMDEHNQALVDAKTRTLLEETEFEIVSGAIDVVSLRRSGKQNCPYLDTPFGEARP